MLENANYVLNNTSKHKYLIDETSAKIKVSKLETPEQSDEDTTGVVKRWILFNLLY